MSAAAQFQRHIPFRESQPRPPFESDPSPGVIISESASPRDLPPSYKRFAKAVVVTRCSPPNSTTCCQPTSSGNAAAADRQAHYTGLMRARRKFEQRCRCRAVPGRVSMNLPQAPAPQLKGLFDDRAFTADLLYGRCRCRTVCRLRSGFIFAKVRRIEFAPARTHLLNGCRMPRHH